MMEGRKGSAAEAAPPATWLLPGDPGPRGRSQSDISSFCSSRRSHPLRFNITGSVDGLDKASIANSDGPPPGSQTPPFKRKGKLSTIGKIFKPWKWRKKKTSDKFKETSAVLERKISTRQSREELIRKGVLKEMPEQVGDVTVNFETSNGHTITISEETIQEENVVKTTEDNGSLSAKASAVEGKKEDKKASSSHVKKLPVSQSSSSQSLSSTSSHPKASKETAPSKTGTSGTARVKKKPGKQSAPRTRADGDVSSTSNAAANSLETKVESSQSEQPSVIISESEDTDQQSKLIVPPPPTAPPPPPPPLLPPSSPSSASQSTGSSETPDVPISTKAGLSVPGSDSNPLLQTEHETDNEDLSSIALDNSLDRSEENTTCSVTKEDQEEETPNLASSQPTEEPPEPMESESSKESHTSDSDSDGPILYTDDDDDDDDNTSAESSLASKIRRRDTLAIKLGNRPSKKELEDKNILQRTSEEERQEIRHQIGTKLVRRLSQRPTTEELEQRNILKQKNAEEEQEARRELKRSLSRKLSLRPTVAELQARRILRFNEYVEVTESPDYDRRADKPWARLTPADKAAIRKELNEFKSTEMEVHEESRQFTSMSQMKFQQSAGMGGEPCFHRITENYMKVSSSIIV
ncbi:phosphatase and actin regulator 2 isoform X1 [Gopherus flavomarginatus]|uniref:phosphatase and actin regulator 2 isoform X1 n=1 Tax=Gopherus flavomarginatus TaxID=286002 RepID=UPI0021CBE2E5|nr:phosphatase and actin regulator 2 isoform X1 [Gopherus flavomarginatus]